MAVNTKEVIKETEHDMKKAIEAVERQFAEVRTGRATSQLVDGLRVDYYGTPTLLKQLASIAVPDARLIIIQPWDPSSIQEIEKAILKSNLGITPANDGKIIRLAIPPLSEERREELAKVVKNMAEEGRISIRTIRRKANDSIKKFETDKTISEDARFSAQEEAQKLTDQFIKKIDELLENKDKELTQF